MLTSSSRAGTWGHIYLPGTPSTMVPGTVPGTDSIDRVFSSVLIWVVQECP